jgi:gamma-glutamyltranspeptidase
VLILQFIQKKIDYRVEWGKAVETELGNDQTLYTIPLPGTGAVLTFMLDLIKGFPILNDGLTWHRITEAFKFGYAKRTHLGDPAFVPGMQPVRIFCQTKLLTINYDKDLIHSLLIT